MLKTLGQKFACGRLHSVFCVLLGMLLAPGCAPRLGVLVSPLNKKTLALRSNASPTVFDGRTHLRCPEPFGVSAASLLANIDISECPTTQLRDAAWRYAATGEPDRDSRL